ncbi:unnamed protein product [Gadus morhua 'NCC']
MPGTTNKAATAKSRQAVSPAFVSSSPWRPPPPQMDECGVEGIRLQALVPRSPPVAKPTGDKGTQITESAALNTQEGHPATRRHRSARLHRRSSPRHLAAPDPRLSVACLSVPGSDLPPSSGAAAHTWPLRFRRLTSFLRRETSLRWPARERFVDCSQPHLQTPQPHPTPNPSPNPPQPQPNPSPDPPHPQPHPPHPPPRGAVHLSDYGRQLAGPTHQGASPDGRVLTSIQAVKGVYLCPVAGRRPSPRARASAMQAGPRFTFR